LINNKKKDINLFFKKKMSKVKVFTPKVLSVAPQLLPFDEGGVRKIDFMKTDFKNKSLLTKKYNPGDTVQCRLDVGPDKVTNLRYATISFTIKIGNTSAPTNIIWADNPIAFKRNLLSLFNRIYVTTGESKPIFDMNYPYLSYDIMSKCKGTFPFMATNDFSLCPFMTKDGSSQTWEELQKTTLGISKSYKFLEKKFGTESWDTGATFHLPLPYSLLTEMNKVANYSNFHFFLSIGNLKNLFFVDYASAIDTEIPQINITDLVLNYPAVTPTEKEGRYLLDESRDLFFTGPNNSQLIDLEGNNRVYRLDPILVDSIPKRMIFTFLKRSNMDNIEAPDFKYLPSSDTVYTAKTMMIANYAVADTAEGIATGATTSQFSILVPVTCEFYTNGGYIGSKFILKNFKNVCGGTRLNPDPNHKPLSLISQVAVYNEGADSTLGALVFDTFDTDLRQKWGLYGSVAGDWFTHYQVADLPYSQPTIELDDSQKNYLDYAKIEIEGSYATGKNSSNSQNLITAYVGEEGERLLLKENMQELYDKFLEIGGFDQSNGIHKEDCAYTYEQFVDNPIFTINLSPSNFPSERQFSTKFDKQKKIHFSFEFLENVASDADLMLFYMFIYDGKMSLTGKGDMQTATTELF